MKLLVISSIYPGNGTPDTYTPVVHYFVREWIKLGYEVKVIHTCTYFPQIYYKAPEWLRRQLQNRLGIPLPEVRLDEEVEYEYEGVVVYRIPMRKIIPMGRYSEKEIRIACEKIDNYISRNNYMPQYIISHWLNPQLEIMSYLKNKIGATTALVLHGAGKRMFKPFKNWLFLKDNVDIWGYRSLAIKEVFESLYGSPQYSFRCYSGIPAYYLQNIPLRDGIFHNHFTQVGLLIERKYPDKTIEAITTVYGNDEFSLNMIGDGSMKNDLNTKIEQMGIKDKIHLLGRMPRKEIINYLDNTDVFVLVSRDEVFGLVYIEAMARGCLVIASRGGGMEGIITHGYNGFLCEAGNATDLARIITHIRSMSENDRKRMSYAAIATASNLTDFEVARNYIESIVRYGRIIKEKSE